MEHKRKLRYWPRRIARGRWRLNYEDGLYITLFREDGEKGWQAKVTQPAIAEPVLPQLFTTIKEAEEFFSTTYDLVPRYPEHDKLTAIEKDRDTVQEFLDWLLDDRGWTLAELRSVEQTGFRGETYETEEFLPIRENRETILGLYFGIDPQKLSEEKSLMLDDIRAANARREEAYANAT